MLVLVEYRLAGGVPRNGRQDDLSPSILDPCFYTLYPLPAPLSVCARSFQPSPSVPAPSASLCLYRLLLPLSVCTCLLHPSTPLHSYRLCPSAHPSSTPLCLYLLLVPPPSLLLSPSLSLPPPPPSLSTCLLYPSPSRSVPPLPLYPSPSRPACSTLSLFHLLLSVCTCLHPSYPYLPSPLPRFHLCLYVSLYSSWLSTCACPYLAPTLSISPFNMYETTFILPLDERSALSSYWLNPMSRHFWVMKPVPRWESLTDVETAQYFSQLFPGVWLIAGDK